MMTLRLALMGAAAGLALATAAHAQTAQTASTEWPTYGHDSGGMRFSPLNQITPANVGQLKQAWVYHMGPPGVQMVVGGAFGGPPPGAAPAGAPGAPAAAPPAGGPPAAGAAPPAGGGGRGAPEAPGTRRYAQSEVTPLVIDGMMYISTPYGRVVALDSSTGKEIWTYPAQAATRGVEYWPGDRSHAPRIVFGAQGGIVSLDAKTGKPADGFGVNGVVSGPDDTRGGGSSPPIIVRNVIISGSANPNKDGTGAAIRGFDVVTGKQLWRWDTVPKKGEPGYDTWAPGSAERQTQVHLWGGLTADVQRGLVFVPLDAPDWDRYGGDRHGANLYGTSVVALNTETGKYVWHFQMVHHDIWDLDVSSPPALIDVRQNGRTIPAVAAIGKMGILFILDRTTGKPIYGVEERPVAKSDIPGELASPTQPFPLKPPPLARTTFSMAEIAKITPEHTDYCTKLITENNIGIGGPYNPPGYNRPTLNFPGAVGSANYGGVSFNPQLRLLFVNTHDLGQLTGIGEKGQPRRAIGVAGAGPGNNPAIPYDMVGLLGRFKEPDKNMMCNQPPWGSLYAVNVDTGEIAWRVNLGVTDVLPADKQDTGRPNLGGTITTASGLVFVGATDDARFRAFDGKTGKKLWEVKLKASSHSVPVTYLGKDGKQYLAFPSTGGSLLQDPAADDALIAYSLP